MTKINLQLEPNPNGQLIYFPGHFLKGIVEMTLDSVKKFRGFHVTIYGEARAHWTETRTRTTGSGENRRTTTYTVHFEGKEVYLNSRTYLFGQRGGHTFEIQPGVHRYEFACQLPDQLPYTTELKHGHIRYYAEAVLDIPWRFDKEITAPFTVVRYDDLNLFPELKIAQKFEEVKTFCCLFCESGPLIVTVTIPYTGFCGGHPVPITIDYTNKSDVDVLRTKLKLKRTIAFTSHTPERKTKTDTEKMVEKLVEGIKKGDSKCIQTTFDIPQTMMCSNGRFCQVVRISYVMEIEAEVDGCHSNPEIAFPVVIGNIPLRFDNQFVPPQTSIEQPQMPFQQPFVPPVPFVQPSAPVGDEYANDLPPTFEQAMNMPKPECTPLVQPQPSPSGNFGWNIEVPSAPANEKQ
ncbi:arrestin domain-containing protein 3-like [Chironomus tepperi]|uniref:arrestin domain-containing protein 3-like n=1 Tax=Chironomus tepperi TaxID=113505 RepID=UPI00391F46CB